MGPKRLIPSLWLVLAVNTVCCWSLEQPARLRCKIDEIVSYRLSMTQQMWGGDQANKVNVSVDVDINCESDDILARGVKGLKYNLHIYHVTVTPLDPDGKEMKPETKTVDDASEENEDEEGLESDDDDAEETTDQRNAIVGLRYRTGSYPLDQKFSRPFYFIQLENGTILYVLHPHDEDRQVVNIKKSIAGLFQTDLSDGESDVEEADATSVHMAHYKMTKNGPNEMKVNKQINKGDVIRFPKGSGADPSNFDYEEAEEILYADGEPQKITGRIRASVARSAQDDAEDMDEGMSEADTDSSEYMSHSGIDDKLTVEEQFTLQLVGRRKRRSSRSLSFARLDNDRQLTKSSLASLVDERDTTRTHLNYMRQQASSPGRVLQAIRSNDDHVLNKTYDKFLMLLDLEGHCELLHCSSEEDTPVANALVHYFYEADKETKIKLLSSLVASGTQIAQQALTDVLKSPTDHHVEQTAVLHSIAFLQRPSLETVNTVRHLADSHDPDVRASALLAVGALASHSRESISDSITVYLVLQLKNLQLGNSTEQQRFVPVVLHALANTKNPKAAATLMDFTRLSNDEETQMIAAMALKDYIELVSVVDNFTALLLSNESVADVAAAILIDILTDKLINQRPRATIPHLQQLETALFERTDGHPLLEPYASRYFSQRGGHSSGRAKRTTTTVSSYDWASTHSQFNDISSLSQRQSDKSKYPLNKAYMYGKKYGVDKLHLRYTVGAFGGLNTQSGTGKVFARAVAYAHAFGYTKEAALVHLSVLLGKTSFSYWSFIRLAGTVVLNHQWSWSSCLSKSVTLLPHRNVQLFQKTLSVPVLMTTLSFDLSANIGYSVTGYYNICPVSLRGTASITGDGYFTATATVGRIDLLWTIRAGIEVSATMNYYVTPSVALTGSGSVRKACLTIYHGRKQGSQVKIEAYYQIRSQVKWGWPLRIDWLWGSRKTLLSKTWSLGNESANTLFNSCSSSYSAWG